jgi:hypothetical protein
MVNGIVFGGETARTSQQFQFCNAEAELSGIFKISMTLERLFQELDEDDSFAG